MILQPILDLVSLCAQKGVHEAVLSPGSRCAPITLAFARHPDIHSRTISDERAAAFIALGMAQQLEKPVVLVCTSGSAAYNYAPAIAEAYFQQVPLLVITADRPAEWIDQWDGQTIRQREIFGKHVKRSFDFPDEYSHSDKVWHANRIANEAINLACQFPAGPVHINIPLREPFYPEADETFDFSKPVRCIEHTQGINLLSDEQKRRFTEEIKAYQKILIVPGQQRPNENIQEALNLLSRHAGAVVVTDSISNMQSEETINFHDQFIAYPEIQDQLAPDLIISFGKSIISKNLKLFLRKSKAAHWQIQPAGDYPDTYQSMTKSIACQPLAFLQFLKAHARTDLDYIQTWKHWDNKVAQYLPELLQASEFGEYKALASCLKKIPASSKLHLANSMAVRYVNFLGQRAQEIVANRGTSGIDGSNSTAVGCALTTKEPVTLVTGDLAFFYDRNAFWHNYSTANLRIILLNNHAGGIFRLIDGPSKQPELEEYFETKQNLDAASLAKEFGFQYHLAVDENSLEETLKDFYQKSTQTKILEIHSESVKNSEVLKTLKASLKEKLFS